MPLLLRMWCRRGHSMRIRMNTIKSWQTFKINWRSCETISNPLEWLSRQMASNSMTPKLTTISQVPSTSNSSPTFKPSRFYNRKQRQPKRASSSILRKAVIPWSRSEVTKGLIPKRDVIRSRKDWTVKHKGVLMDSSSKREWVSIMNMRLVNRTSFTRPRNRLKSYSRRERYRRETRELQL